MKKVTAFIGNHQKHSTYKAVCEFERNLKAYGNIEFEIVFLKDYQLEYCRGCKVCFDKGEEYCPLHDDRDILMEKMIQSDGVIFATPNYAFHVSAPIKNLLDRLAFTFHRPRFSGRPLRRLLIRESLEATLSSSILAVWGELRISGLQRLCPDDA